MTNKLKVIFKKKGFMHFSRNGKQVLMLCERTFALRRNMYQSNANVVAFCSPSWLMM